MTSTTNQVQLSVVEEYGVELIILDAPGAQVVIGPNPGNLVANVFPTNSNVTSLATASSLLGGIRTGTPSANIDLQLPTGTSMDLVFDNFQSNQAFSWSIINLAPTANSITVTVNDGHSVVGNMVVAAATSARFLTRKTAANTFVTYRAS